MVRLANNVINAQGAYASTFSSMLKISVIDKKFFSLFLILFVAAVGLLAADKISLILKTYGTKFVVLGLLIVFIGAGTTYTLTILSNKANPYEVSGVYTGALTSSPGLAAAIETSREHAKEWTAGYSTLSHRNKEILLNILNSNGTLTPENTPTLSSEQKEEFIIDAEAGVGVGHAIGYPFGVLIVILAMKLFPKIFKLDLDEEHRQFQLEMAEARKKVNIKHIDSVTFDLIAFSFVCILGYTFGMFKVNLGYLGYFSLGSTGGILLSSIFFGHIGKLGFMTFRMDKKILGVIRDISLTFFLGIVGLRYGYAAINSLTGAGFYLCIVAIAVGVLSMFSGFLVGKYVFKINWIMLSGAICGGMTSTPGLGVAVDVIGTDDPATGYAATYPFALFGIVLFTIILHNLPM
ncbi:hypothetical protein [Psychrilyobacter sp.]|uniref:aspartate-alanine antiporter-like transporter n=1 Tax=Psychrilyobacter sp. TaxID=2586924 RepID=UPI00301A8274